MLKPRWNERRLVDFFSQFSLLRPTVSALRFKSPSQETHTWEPRALYVNPRPSSVMSSLEGLKCCSLKKKEKKR